MPPRRKWLPKGKEPMTYERAVKELRHVILREVKANRRKKKKHGDRDA